MRQVYKKRNTRPVRQVIRYSGLMIAVAGFFSLLYILFPFISWKFYFEPAFAANTVQSPIPKSTVLTSGNIRTYISDALGTVNVDYTDARNWFPQYKPSFEIKPLPEVVTTFNISIPALKIQYANVSTISTDLSEQLILYPGTPLPPAHGNAVILGHSTIPGWFNPKDYKTIFATLHTLKTGDDIFLTVNAKEYNYRIVSINVTSAKDTTVFAQDEDEAFLTLITCTPPGTTWKRLIVKAKLEK